MNGLLETLRKLGPVKLAALGGVALLMIGLFVFIGGRLSQPQMALLYADLDPADSSQIVAKLESAGVPFELQADGAQIMVPKEQALRLRMSMAQEGLPSGGSIGYEIFDREDALGTTNFVQRVNHLRALEGELARTIRAISQVSSARVHLVMPERALFSREQPQPSASIIITTKRGVALDQAEVQAIQHLVAAAVPGLKPSAISIVDSWGTLLARGGEDTPGEAGGATAESMRQTYERRLARSIEELLQRSLGFGSVRAEVSADMDFDRITTNAEIYDPDGQVVRSTQTVEESSDSSDGEGSQAVSVTSNLPDPTAEGGAVAGTSDRSARTEEIVNYEISKKVETHVREAGMVRRLSIAVLVDGTYQAAADGTTSYRPRSAEELAQIDKLVRSAAGVDIDRGDTVEVVNMPFTQEAEAGEPVDEGMLMGLDTGDMLRVGELLIMAVLGILALLFIARPIVSRLLQPLAAVASTKMALLTSGDGNAVAALPAPGGQGAAPAAIDIEQMIDVGQVQGRVKASSLKKIAELVQNHPEEAVNIVRTWMSQSEK